MRSTTLLAQPLLLSLGLCLALPAPADPPPWAPAHGWRKQNDPYYQGYTGARWERDFGIVDGRCNREAIGAVLGGAVGGVVGAQVGKGESRGVASVAIVLGAAIGASLGARIGRDMDQTDRACFGHALELGPKGRAVRWTGPGGTAYVLTPLERARDAGPGCRRFRIEARGEREHERAGRMREKRQGTACRGADGVWRIVG
jgi:surface antigen